MSSFIDPPLQSIRSGIEIVGEIYHRQQRNVAESSMPNETGLLNDKIAQAGTCFGVYGMRIQMVRPCGSVWLNLRECSEP